MRLAASFNKYKNSNLKFLSCMSKKFKFYCFVKNFPKLNFIQNF